MKPFEITDSAKAQIERLLEKNPGKYAVSLAVLGGGCAGFKYEWGFADTKENVAEGDHVPLVPVERALHRQVGVKLKHGPTRKISDVDQVNLGTGEVKKAHSTH